MEKHINLDQHFLVSEEIIARIITADYLGPEDHVLEIGSGTGNITREILKKTKHLIVVEKDPQFISDLESLGITVINDDAIEYLKKNPTPTINKLISNVPFQIIEPLIKFLVFARHINDAILVTPETIIALINDHPIFSAFLQQEKVCDVPPSAFDPPPKTVCAVIKVIHRKEFEEDPDLNAFVRRKLYMQEDKKLKNALIRLIQDASLAVKGNKVSKFDAKKEVESWKIDQKVLDALTSKAPLEIYTNVAKRIEVFIQE